MEILLYEDLTRVAFQPQRPQSWPQNFRSCKIRPRPNTLRCLCLFKKYSEL